MPETISAESVSQLAHVIIEPDSPEMRAQSLLRAREITKRYFTIGRRSSGSIARARNTLPDHLVAEKYPYTVSREHCEIERFPSGIYVRDLNSRMGTVVNGTRISSRQGHESEIVLGLGEHSVVLGRRDGVIRFRIIVSEPDPQST